MLEQLLEHVQDEGAVGGVATLEEMAALGVDGARLPRVEAPDVGPHLRPHGVDHAVQLRHRRGRQELRVTVTHARPPEPDVSEPELTDPAAVDDQAATELVSAPGGDWLTRTSPRRSTRSLICANARSR